MSTVPYQNCVTVSSTGRSENNGQRCTIKAENREIQNIKLKTVEVFTWCWLWNLE